MGSISIIHPTWLGGGLLATSSEAPAGHVLVSSSPNVRIARVGGLVHAWFDRVPSTQKFVVCLSLRVTQGWCRRLGSRVAAPDVLGSVPARTHSKSKSAVPSSTE